MTGHLTWIGLRPNRDAAMLSVETVWVDPVKGLLGDRAGASSNRNRKITLIQEDHLYLIAERLGRAVAADLTRRNLVISGLDLRSLRKQSFRIGPVILAGTGLCHPCPRMNLRLGPGGLAAMSGLGGITAAVVSGGQIRLGDEVSLLQSDLFESLLQDG